MHTKIVSVITALSLIFGLAACGNDLFTTDVPVTKQKQLLNIPSNANEAGGYWLFKPLDDDRGAAVFLIGASENDIHTLNIRCEWTSEGDKLEVFWHFPNSSVFGRVTVKYGLGNYVLDHQRIIEEWQKGSANNSVVAKAVFAPFAVQFARYLIANHKKILSISYIDSNNNSDTARFEIIGADVAVQWVLDNCGY